MQNNLQYLNIQKHPLLYRKVLIFYLRYKLLGAHFLVNTHLSRKELKDVVKDKDSYKLYSLVNNLGEDYLMKILESEEEFNKFKKDNINNVLINLTKNVKPAFNKWFEYFKNKIVIIEGKLT